jgi:hypothetical protein
LTFNHHTLKPCPKAQQACKLIQASVIAADAAEVINGVVESLEEVIGVSKTAIEELKTATEAVNIASVKTKEGTVGLSGGGTCILATAKRR